MQDKESEMKISRIRTYLLEHGYTGMILARQDNFSWLSAGGNNRVVVPREQGYGMLVVTQDSVYLTAQVMDGQRLMDEELNHIECEYVPLKWYEESMMEKAVSLAGIRPVSDTAQKGAVWKEQEIYNLHFPLTPWEIDRLRTVGEISDQILYKTANQIRPGMMDYEVEAMLLYEYALHNIQCDVLLIGTDERIFKYRHPSPVGRELGSYVFLHPAVRYKGLHCNVTRSIYFGDTLPEEIKRAYDAVSYIEAYCLDMCGKQAYWKEILEGQKRILKERGFGEEWKNHYPGGRTGYFVCQADLSLSEEKKTMKWEAYDWFITVTGAKAEELSVHCEEGVSVFSDTGLWPGREIEAGGSKRRIPQIMMR